MLFILTRDKSLLLFLSRSSSLSIFRFCCRSMLSPCASFFFSTVMKQKYNIHEKIIVQAFFQNTFFRYSSREIKLTSLALPLHFCLQLLILFCAIHKQPGQSYGGKGTCISNANNVSKLFLILLLIQPILPKPDLQPVAYLLDFIHGKGKNSLRNYYITLYFQAKKIAWCAYQCAPNINIKPLQIFSLYSNSFLSGWCSS